MTTTNSRRNTVMNNESRLEIGTCHPTGTATPVSGGLGGVTGVGGGGGAVDGPGRGKSGSAAAVVVVVGWVVGGAVVVGGRNGGPIRAFGAGLANGSRAGRVMRVVVGGVISIAGTVVRAEVVAGAAFERRTTGVSMTAPNTTMPSAVATTRPERDLSFAWRRLMSSSTVRYRQERRSTMHPISEACGAGAPSRRGS
jgi:hypothetical protein